MATSQGFTYAVPTVFFMYVKLFKVEVHRVTVRLTKQRPRTRLGLILGRGHHELCLLKVATGKALP
jgi:hypothetical protein